MNHCRRDVGAGELCAFPSKMAKHQSVEDIKLLLTYLIPGTEFTCTQKNGARITGPFISSDVAPKGSEIFIAKIPEDCYEKELLPMLLSLKGFNCLRLMLEFSGSHRGFAFAEFINPHLAEAAVNELNRKAIKPGHYIGACISVDNRKLVIRGFNQQITAEELGKFLVKQVNNLKKVVTYTVEGETFGVIEFKRHSDAACARKILMTYSSRVCNGVHMEIDWACPSEWYYN